MPDVGFVSQKVPPDASRPAADRPTKRRTYRRVRDSAGYLEWRERKMTALLEYKTEGPQTPKRAAIVAKKHGFTMREILRWSYADRGRRKGIIARAAEIADGKMIENKVAEASEALSAGLAHNEDYNRGRLGFVTLKSLVPEFQQDGSLPPGATQNNYFFSNDEQARKFFDLERRAREPKQIGAGASERAFVGSPLGDSLPDQERCAVVVEERDEDL